MKKYPRTYHLPFSPEVHSDDKVCDISDLEKIIERKIPVVITVKADGGNCCLKKDGVMARSHSQETSCPSFNYIKNVHFYPNLADIAKDDLKVFGENLFAIHSIEYENLKDYFYVFNIVKGDRFLSFDDVVEWTTNHNMQTVPVVFDGIIPSISWLEKFLAEELKKPCELGSTREGFVVRVKDWFPVSEFSKNVFKYVRKGHIQEGSEHWSRNWKQATLNKQ